MARKTVAVAFVRDRVHAMSERADGFKLPGHPSAARPMTPEEAFRMGANTILEMILFDTGNYRGFGYRDMTTDADGKPVIPDETRRVYY